MATTSKKFKVVYIAGNSFSGSTVLGLLLGSAPTAFFAGEVKKFIRINRNKSPDHPGSRICTCGKKFDECSMWSLVRSQVTPHQDFNPSPGFSLVNIKLILRVLSPFYRGECGGVTTEYGALLESIYSQANRWVKDAEYVVDSSKSMYCLYSLVRSSNVNVYVVQIVRDGIAVVSSYKKRGRGVWYGMAAWIMANVFMRMFIKRIKPKTITVNYERLCHNLPAELEKINQFLGVSLEQASIVNNVKNERYHVVGGNRGVYKFAQKEREFEGIKFSDDRTNLSQLESSIARLILTPFNKVFFE